jgi:hypothetical protein
LQPGKSSAKSNFAIVGIQYQYGQLLAYVNTKGIPAEIQIEKLCNFLEGNMTSSFLVLSPSSILLQRPTHCHFVHPRKIYYRAFFFFAFFSNRLSLKLRNFKFRSLKSRKRGSGRSYGETAADARYTKIILKEVLPSHVVFEDWHHTSAVQSLVPAVGFIRIRLMSVILTVQLLLS